MKSASPTQSRHCATLRCLGAAAVVLESPGDPPESVVALGKPLALLAYLALAPRRTASRERLTDLLWGDQDRPTARHSVRVALYYLRSHIGEWVIETAKQSCTASPDLRVDVLEFIAALERDDFGRALDLYRGDFLADFASPGCREFEHWAQIERAHLRTRAVGAGEALCRELLDHGRFVDARRAAERVRDIDAHSERTWRLILEVLVAGGDRLAAAAEAARFEARLEAEGCEPEPASREAIRSAQRTITSIAPSDSTGAGLIAELVGRERHFAAMLEAWRRASQGNTQLVVVSGAAGLGKSRLLSAFENRLRFQRQRVLQVRAYPGEHSNAFAFGSALAYALGRLRGAAGTPATVTPHLVALDARLSEQFHVGPATLTGPPAVTQRSIALRELITAVCDDGPLVLLIDDAHWIDEPSRQLLAGALSRLEGAPVLVVVATRSADSGLSIEPRASALHLDPLSLGEIEALVASVGTLPKDEDWPAFMIARVTAASRGIPLFVLGALEQLLADGTLELRDGEWHTPARGRLRDRLRNIDALGARLRALPDLAFRFLLGLSLAGVPLPRAVAVRLAQGVDPSLAGVPEELERLGYVRVGDASVEVGHDAVAETALDIASTELRREIGRQLGRVLLEENEDHWVERGIRQLVAAGDPEATHDAVRRLVTTRARRTAVHAVPEVARLMALPIDDARVGEAARSVPLMLRYPIRRPVVVAATLILAVGVATGAALRAMAPPPPDAVLDISTRVDRLHARHGQVLIRGASWTTTGSLPIAWQSMVVDTTTPPRFGALLRPGRDEWATEWQSPDSGEQDVVLAGSRGIIERLTNSRFDEVPDSWSPDGSQVAVETAQFGREGHRVMGVLDVASRKVRPLGDGAGFEGDARWSPDGTRIAFIRDLRDASPELLCVSPISGPGHWCTKRGGNMWMLGWMDNDHLLVAIGPPLDSAGQVTSAAAPQFEVTELDTHTRQLRRVGLRVSARPDLSPDGRWLVYSKAPAFDLHNLLIAPSTDISHSKPVVAGDESQDIVVTWRGTRARRAFLDSVRIEAASDTILVGAPFQVHATGVSNRKTVMEVRALSWRSLDTRVATVDSTGVVRARRAGSVEIEASAGGWRRARKMLQIVETPLDTLLIENWTTPLEPRWKPYGTQLPKIARDPVLGHAFWNNGNGTYFSGVYQRTRAFATQGGLALDATIRVWITRDQWQYLDFGLTHIRDVDQLARTWDHRHGYLPTQFTTGGAGCQFAYPAGEGAAAVLAAEPGGELPHAPGAKLPPLGLGLPTRIRIQILPDARCGVAIDGRAVYLSAPLQFDSVRVFAQGSSLGTKVLVGPLLVRRGVPPDVDWNQVRPASNSPPQR